jgi:alkanesulfonate monooxygenase SsuD/methylene tetrahydromethanopterin reductase-like flavin-dependent oxidoreductase (luciferase family)
MEARAREATLRIGLVIGLHGGPPEGSREAPRWEGIQRRARAAEAAGFDLVVLEDALLYRDEDETIGYWESIVVAGALAAATERIQIGHSVLNGPYRSPALVAKIAETLDEVSAGRYVLGLGRGNVPDHDYAAFGFTGEDRTARFEEALQIIHGLLKEGRVDFVGRHWSARQGELVMRGPHPQGPPIVVAAKGPRMLRLAARYADGWNWWTDAPDTAPLRPVVDELERACNEVGRDPASLPRSLDVYSLDPLGRYPGQAAFGGGAERIAGQLLAFGELGVEEVRVNLYHPPDDLAVLNEALASLSDVVAILHAA